jgi:hypothetical protein
LSTPIATASSGNAFQILYADISLKKIGSQIKSTITASKLNTTNFSSFNNSSTGVANGKLTGFFALDSFKMVLETSDLLLLNGTIIDVRGY